MSIATPVVGAVTENTSATTTCVVAYPGSVAAGGVAYLFVTNGAAGLATLPAGFTQLARFSNTGSTLTPATMVARKTTATAGTEGGTSVTVTVPSSLNAGVIVVVPSGVDLGTFEDVTTVTGDNTSASTAAGNAGATVVTTGSLGLYFTANGTSANTVTQTSGFTHLATRSLTSRGFEVSYKNALPTGATGALSDTYSGSAKSDTVFVVARAAIAASITSAAATTFVVGQAGTFTVTTTGTGPMTIARTGAALPSGVTFVDNGNGTGTLAGTPGAGTGGTYAETFTPTGQLGAGSGQSFTLTVNQAPAITSANSVTITQNSAMTPFTVTTTGFPTNTITETGTLPTGVTFVDNGNNTATISGTPTNSGSFPITITAANGVGSNATQSFTITDNASSTAATFTSATSTSFTEHTAGTFTVTTTGGNPTPVLTKTGALPSGITFTDNGNGTATIAGTSGFTTVGSYPITITATNSAGAPTQSFTLTIATYVPGLTNETLQHALNRVAGTSNLDAQGAAQVWASAATLDLLGCLNKKAGNTVNKGLLGVLNQLAGTTNKDQDECARNLH